MITLNEGQLVNATIEGEVVLCRVVTQPDPDPECSVWLCEVNDPDVGHFITRQYLVNV